ncbi:MAG: zeta toxin family protein [Prosthecobacter sp.]
MSLEEARQLAHEVFGGTSQSERVGTLREAVQKLHILGSNQVTGGQSRSILNGGANFLTATEEIIEGRWKAGAQSGRYTKEQMLGWVRAAEKATGESYLSAMSDAEVLGSTEAAPRSLTEAISRIVVAEVLGRKMDGGRLRSGPGAVTRGLAGQQGQSQGGNSSSAFVALLKTFRSWLGQVFDTAHKLRSARAEGKLGEEHDAVLDDLLGANQTKGNEAATGEIHSAINQANASIDNSVNQSAGQTETFSLAARNELEQQTALPLDQRFALIPSGPELRSTTRDYFRDHLMTLAGDQLPVTRDGRVVKFTMTGFKEMRQHSADPRVLQMLPSMPEMLRKAVPIFSESNTEPNKPNIRAYHHYAIKSTLGGEEFYARLVVREDESGESHYDADATSVLLFKESGEQSPHQPDRKPNAGEDKAALAKGRLYQWWHSVNSDSKYSPPSSGINQAAPVIQEDDAGSGETHSLAAPPDNTDSRLRDAFRDWKHGWDEQGFPNPPRVLPDDDPRLEKSIEKKTARLPSSHPLVRAGLLSADQDVPRATLHHAIVEYFMRQGKTLLPGVQPTIYAMGGGGGAGKSTILESLEEAGGIDREHAVLVNADTIKELIPEYNSIIEAGDGRAADVVHAESSDITTLLMDRLIPPNRKPPHNIIFDGTLANGPYSRQEMARWKAAGMRVHLIGVTIDPREAIKRASLRGLDTRRWVPASILMNAHRGFNAELKSYLPLSDLVHIFDNTGSKAHAIIEKSSPDTEVSIENRDVWNMLNQRAQ